MIKAIKTAMWDIIRTEGIEVTNQNIDWLLEKAWKSAQVTDAPPAKTSEKQIEEIAKAMCWEGADCSKCEGLLPCDKKFYAPRLVDKGYRRASEVAREILDILKSAGIDKYRYPMIAEIEKKYEEGE